MADFEFSEEEARRILRQRAVELGREAVKQEAADTLRVVVFKLAHETYGVETAFVREVHPMKELWPLPCVPEFVIGLVRVRGEVLSLTDLKKFWGLPEKGLAERNMVIVLHDAQMELAILADELLGVVEVALEESSAEHPALRNIGSKYLKGVTTENVIILDASELLRDPNVLVYQEA